MTVTEAHRARPSPPGAVVNPDLGRTIIFVSCIAGMILFAWNATVQWDQISGERLIQWVGFIGLLAGIATRNAVGLEAVAQSWDILGIWLMITGLTSINLTILVTGVRHTRKLRTRRQGTS